MENQQLIILKPIRYIEYIHPKKLKYIITHSKQELGTWLPNGENGECGKKTVPSSTITFGNRIVGGKQCKLGECAFMALLGLWDLWDLGRLFL